MLPLTGTQTTISPAIQGRNKPHCLPLIGAGDADDASCRKGFYAQYSASICIVPHRTACEHERELLREWQPKAGPSTRLLTPHARSNKLPTLPIHLTPARESHWFASAAALCACKCSILKEKKGDLSPLMDFSRIALCVPRHNHIRPTDRLVPFSGLEPNCCHPREDERTPHLAVPLVG